MIEELPPGIEGSTRDRLLAAGVRLFAEHGFRGTTVGDIEAAAGLQPRRGALYHYFPTKQALLDAAVQTRLGVIEHGLRLLEELPGVDVRAEALLMGRWFLEKLDAEYYLTRILEQDGDRLPELRELIRSRMVDAGHRGAQLAVLRWIGPDSRLDSEALAVILIAPLVNVRRVTWTYGAPPLGMDDDRLLSTWADVCAQLAALRRPVKATSKRTRTGHAHP